MMYIVSVPGSVLDHFINIVYTLLHCIKYTVN